MSLSFLQRLPARGFSAAETCLTALRNQMTTTLSDSRHVQNAGYQLSSKPKKAPIKIRQPAPSLLPKGSEPKQLLEQKLTSELDPTGWRRQLFQRSSPLALRPGDVVRVHFHSETSHTFVGTIMVIRRRGLDTSVRLRSEVAQLGVEMSVKVYSTSVKNFEFISRAVKKARRAKLYYLRPDEKKGK
ncbi:translation protein SH3-like domain-containing protein [Lipomyces tetrasporus]|uniref:Translation protein SH3-like domain-containing protein n=1 Tax=Lipomyces tetrasporus TaxID=54092 RepID=A0AAD7VQV4_9ASCO|nr:translation protein SH3-like domain-containing protein [Lipomyces tetrasporus]KAJ8099307.1 translation protein SH3-like domain-containing protein [Lipomyces tetrasporus]